MTWQKDAAHLLSILESTDAPHAKVEDFRVALDRLVAALEERERELAAEKQHSDKLYEEGVRLLDESRGRAEAAERRGDELARQVTQLTGDLRLSRETASQLVYHLSSRVTQLAEALTRIASSYDASSVKSDIARAALAAAGSEERLNCTCVDCQEPDGCEGCEACEADFAAAAGSVTDTCGEEKKADGR